MELISREAAIAWHTERRDEAKANANQCRDKDEDSAVMYLDQALVHGDAINAIRALPAQAPAVKVRALKWSRVSGVWSGNSKVGATYLVDKNPYSGVWGWAFGDDADEADWNDGFRTVGEAKAAAQADYEARILAALDLS